MSRKKQKKQKVKITSSHSQQSTNSTTMDQSKVLSDKYHSDLHSQQNKQDHTVYNKAVQKNEQNNPDNVLSSVVKVKTEPTPDIEDQTCSNEITTQQRLSPMKNQENTEIYKPAKIKRERLSLDSSLTSRSTHQLVTMDLGSHLQHSLSGSSRSDLTWKQLLEPKNLPKVHIPDKLQSNVHVKAEKHDSGSDMVLSSTDDETPLDLKNNSAIEKSGSLLKDMTSGSGSRLTGSSLSASSNRFSKNYDVNTGVLDLSKKIIPPEIRRVLASKYGVTKRNDDNNSGTIVPNLSKSRSRFTLSSKKTGIIDSEDETNNQTESSKSLSSINSRQSSEMEKSQKSSQNLLKSNSSLQLKSKSVSPKEIVSSIPVAAKITNRRRFSSSTYEGRRPTLDYNEGNKLQKRGLVDLGSHYGSLLKDSPPRLSGRNSRSPYNESPAAVVSDRSGNVTVLKNVDDSEGKVSTKSSRSLVRENIPGNEIHMGTKKLTEVQTDERGRNSKSPLGAESINPDETVLDLANTSHLGQLGYSQHFSTRSSSRSPLDHLTTNMSARGGMTHYEGDRQFQDHHNLSKHSNECSNYDIPRSTSRSPVGSERSTTTPPNIKEPMIELGSGKQFHEYLENRKHSMSRASSRSPVSNDKRSNTSSPHEPIPGHSRDSEMNNRPFNHAAPRSRSRSPVSTDLAGTSEHLEATMDPRSGNRLNDYPNKYNISRSRSISPVATDLTSKIKHSEEMIELSSSNPSTDQQRSKSRSPRSESGQTTEAMIDLSSTSRLHERRGTPQMKPLNAMIDLNSMENQASPLSPGFGVLPFSSFPSQVYRHPNRPRYPYKSKTYLNRPQKPLSPALGSPGFSPRLPFGARFNYPPNHRYRLSGAPMIDLGSLGKSSEFQGGVASRSSETPVRSGGLPKRRHSVDSESLVESVKKPRLGNTDQRSEVKPGGSGVRLNVNDLLHLEREEQKYIQELSSVQSKLTEVRFKMHRMQQELDTLKSSEHQIKQSIDVVRAKRVKILKDAQDHQESKGTSEVLGAGDIGTRRGNEGSKDMKESNKDVAYRRGSLGFFSNQNDDTVPERTDVNGKNNAFEGNSFKDRKDMSKNNSQRNSDKNDEKIPSRFPDSGGQNKNRNMRDDPALTGVDYSSSMNDHHHPKLPTNTPSIQHYPITSSNSERSYHAEFKPTTRREKDWEGSSPGSPQAKLSKQIETFESADGSTITLNRDGTMVLRKNKTETNQMARKRSNPTIFEEVCVGLDEKRTDYAGTTSNESQQFLGCLEITSTTHEMSGNEDDGPKEVLAEKERENLASKLRCDQDRISTTVPSLEIEQDNNSTASASEMDFIGHTDAVCYILPYKGKLFSASADRTVKAFDLKTGECVKTFEGHDLAVNCLQISSSGGKTDRLFTGANDQSVRAYNMKSGACTHKFSFRGRVMCLHVAFGKLFVGLSSGFVAVIDLKTNECIDQFNCHEPSRISCLSSATEGKRSLICTGSFDSTITIRDEGTGLLLRHIKDHKLTVLCMQVVENILYSGSADTVVQSHNVNTGELVRSYTGHTMSVSGLQALGGVLVTSSLDRIIRCFDIKTGDLLQLYGGNTDMIFSLSVIGDMIYTGCRDGRVSGIKLDLRKYHCCKWGDCSLKFGMLSHLKQHVQDHINQTIDFKNCFWDQCVYKFPRGKQLDVIQAATEHILSHVLRNSN